MCRIFKEPSVFRVMIDDGRADMLLLGRIMTQVRVQAQAPQPPPPVLDNNNEGERAAEPSGGREGEVVIDNSDGSDSAGDGHVEETEGGTGFNLTSTWSEEGDSGTGFEVNDHSSSEEQDENSRNEESIEENEIESSEESASESATTITISTDDGFNSESFSSSSTSSSIEEYRDHRDPYRGGRDDRRHAYQRGQNVENRNEDGAGAQFLPRFETRPWNIQMHFAFPPNQGGFVPFRGLPDGCNQPQFQQICNQPCCVPPPQQHLPNNCLVPFPILGVPLPFPSPAQHVPLHGYGGPPLLPSPPPPNAMPMAMSPFIVPNGIYASFPVSFPPPLVGPNGQLMLPVSFFQNQIPAPISSPGYCYPSSIAPQPVASTPTEKTFQPDANFGLPSPPPISPIHPQPPSIPPMPIMMVMPQNTMMQPHFVNGFQNLSLEDTIGSPNCNPEQSGWENAPYDASGTSVGYSSWSMDSSFGGIPSDSGDSVGTETFGSSSASEGHGYSYQVRESGQSRIRKGRPLDNKWGRRLLDYKVTFLLDGEELPYVTNTLKLNRSLEKFRAPPPCMDYYVPPTVEEIDFFGGQIYMWHEKMMHYFNRFLPHVWRLQAVPHYEKGGDTRWYGFSITMKLRYCCKTCKSPWTSKQGQVMFAFMFENGFREDQGTGHILMKLFGQKCMKRQGKECDDWEFQTPGCYPEEINRAVAKLSQIVGHRIYKEPLYGNLERECKKSIRNAPPNQVRSPALPEGENHHRKDLCQACASGVCQTRPSQTVLVL